MRRLWGKLANLFRRRGAEREMSREMAAHLALLQEDFEKRGMTPEEAAMAARRAYGGIEQAKELHRETRSFVWIEQFFKDLRYAWNNLTRNPGFTLTAVIALALGIGLNATIFGLYDAIALKPLPVADPSSVVRVERWFADNTFSTLQYNFAYAEYEYLRDRDSAFSAVAATKTQISVLAEIDGSINRASGYAVSANYFDALGVRTQIGRSFLPDEDRLPGANPVVVLDYRYWQRQFHGASDILGRSIKLNRFAYTVIGVAPREFTGTESLPLETDFYAPLSMVDQLDPGFGGWREQWRDSSSHAGFELLARLKPGVSRRQAQSETNVLMRRYLEGSTERNRTTAVTLQSTSYFGNTQEPAFQAAAAVVLLVVSLVLFVACANVANMLLARGVARQREIGIRLSLGAGRGRVMQQLLTESMLLSVLGGAGGVLLSVWSGRLLWLSVSTVFQGFHFRLIEPDLSPDARVLGYGLGLSLLTGVLFGLFPAMQATRAGLNASMNVDGSASGAQLSRSKLRGLLVGSQVTVSVVLLVVGFAMARELVRLGGPDPGFESRDTYWLMADGMKSQALREPLEALPELSGVATGRLPLNGTHAIPVSVGKLNARTEATEASDGYLETLGIRLLAGRSFNREEAKGKAPVAVISESTARLFWPAGDPVGKHLSLDLNSRNEFTDFVVVGVAKDARFADISKVDELHVYLPSTEIPSTGGLLFRIRGDRGRALSAVRSAVQSLDPGLVPSLEMVSLEDGFVALQRGLTRVEAFLAGVIAISSLAMAGVGIYGVMAFLVSQRTREIGVRVALGATAQGIVRNILAQGLRPVFIGMALGFALGAAGNVIARTTEPFPDPLMKSIFSDPSMYGALALMLAVAVVASLVPARRALRVDPAVALRDE